RPVSVWPPLSAPPSEDVSSALTSSSPLLEGRRLKSTIRRLRNESQHSLICIVRLNSHGCAVRVISTTFASQSARRNAGGESKITPPEFVIYSGDAKARSYR